MSTHAFRAALLLALLPATALAQSPADARAEKIAELLAAYHALGQFNGSALVADGGQLVLKKGYGLANMEWQVPNGPDTRFRLGSITKQFTAALVLQQVAKGKLHLDGRLSDYLPDYRKDTGEKVTLHHLLTHTSGIPSYTSGPAIVEIGRDPHDVAEFVKTYCSGDLQFEPGSRFTYNNSGYFLLGAILEKTTGQRYERLLQESILDPLGMKDTGYDHAALRSRAWRQASGRSWRARTTRVPGGALPTPSLRCSWRRVPRPGRRDTASSKPPIRKPTISRSRC